MNGERFGLCFFQQNIIAQIYKTILSRRLLPAVHAQGFDPAKDIVFQQDGASPHTAAITIRYLDRKVKSIISKRSDALQNVNTSQWPPRSLDIIPLDFFLWGYLKSKSFVDPFPIDVQELTLRITCEFNLIS